MKKFTYLLLLSLLVSCQKKPDKPKNQLSLNSKGSAIDLTTYTKFLEKVPQWLIEYNVPAVGIGLIENGKIKSVKVFGELEESVPAPQNTIFNVASITKTIGTMLTLELVERGQWDLDEPLYHYWIDPDVADDPFHKKLTTRHILTHQTGFINWREGHETKKLTFDFEPGTRYQYSGEGLQYLKNAIEHKFYKSIEKLTDSLIFVPLGMKDSRLVWDEKTDEKRFALFHDSDGKKYDVSHKKYDANLADDLLTSVEDYSKFGVYVINGAGLSESLYKDMVTPQSNIQDHSGIGLGWFTVKDFSDEEYGIQHGGSDYGVKTTALFLPKSKRGIVIFTNGDNGVPIIINSIKEAFDNGSTIWNHMYERNSLPEIIEVPNEKLEEYVGLYENPDGQKITVILKENDLIMSGARFAKTILYPYEEDKFFVKEFDQKIEFVREGNARVNKMTINIDGKKWSVATKAK